MGRDVRTDGTGLERFLAGAMGGLSLKRQWGMQERRNRGAAALGGKIAPDEGGVWEGR